MKKMLLAGLMFCMALTTQAAVAKWSITKIVGPEDSAAQVGWLACIYEGSSSDFTYDAAKSGTLVAANTQSAYDNKGTILVNNTTGFGDFSANTTHSMYAVVFDAATIDAAQHYIVSEDLSKTVPANGNPVTYAFGNMSLTTTANKFLNSSWQSVPEPTSGILLLVGGALLALRRKQK